MTAARGPRWRGVALRTAALLLLLALGTRAAGAADPGPISESEYLARLDRAIVLLEEFGPGGLASTNDLLGTGGAGLTVLTADGTAVRVQSPFPAGADAVTTLRYLTAAREAMRAAQAEDSAARLALLQKILAAREFDSLRAGPSVLERVVKALGDFLNWLLRWLPKQEVPDFSGPVGQTSDLWVNMFGVIGALVIAFVLSIWIRALIRAAVRDAAAQRAPDDDDEPTTAAEARTQATELAEIGAYRPAIRRLFLAALLMLEERGALQRDRGLTNREYLEQTINKPPIQRHLTPIVNTFDTVWYGVREPDATTFARFERDVQALERLDDAAHARGAAE